MTAVPHEGLRRGPVRPRAGARLVRPSVSSQRRSNGRLVAAVSASGASVRSGAVNVSALAGSLGAKPIRLVLAGRRVRLGNGAFVFLVLAALSVTLVALLFINTSLAEDSFRLQKITQSARDLTIREQLLNDQLAAAESPVGLENKARELGMVPGGSPLFLNLADAKILGDSTPAQAPAVAAPKAAKQTAPLPTAGDGTGGETPVLPGSGGSSTDGNPTGELVPVDPATDEAAPNGASGEQEIGVIHGSGR